MIGKAGMFAVAAFIALAMFAAAIPADAGGSGHSSHSYSHTRGTSTHARGYHARAVIGVARDSHGRIARSREARAEFLRLHPCPSTGRTRGACPGYVVDHVIALKRGGPDAPSNMQWQTIEESKAKDRVE